MKDSMSISEPDSAGCVKKSVPESERLADAHVDWFLETIRPLLKTHFEHGYKHGMEAKTRRENLSFNHL